MYWPVMMVSPCLHHGQTDVHPNLNHSTTSPHEMSFSLPKPSPLIPFPAFHVSKHGIWRMWARVKGSQRGIPFPLKMTDCHSSAPCACREIQVQILRRRILYVIQAKAWHSSLPISLLILFVMMWTPSPPCFETFYCFAW